LEGVIWQIFADSLVGGPFWNSSEVADGETLRIRDGIHFGTNYIHYAAIFVR
jgi:hypothetical protein